MYESCDTRTVYTAGSTWGKWGNIYHVGSCTETVYAFDSTGAEAILSTTDYDQEECCKAGFAQGEGSDLLPACESARDYIWTPAEGFDAEDLQDGEEPEGICSADVWAKDPLTGQRTDIFLFNYPDFESPIECCT